MSRKRQTGCKDRRFGICFFLAAAVLGLTAAILLITISRGNSNPKADGYSTLEIVNTVSKKVYLRRVIEETGGFTIEFIHSVNNSPVQEIFKIEDRRIKPAMLRFYSFGAGMPSELEEGQQMERDGDAIVITGFSRAYTELNYIIGTVSDHLLIINEERISLRELCGRNAHITLRIMQ